MAIYNQLNYSTLQRNGSVIADNHDYMSSSLAGIRIANPDTQPSRASSVASNHNQLQSGTRSQNLARIQLEEEQPHSDEHMFTVTNTNDGLGLVAQEITLNRNDLNTILNIESDSQAIDNGKSNSWFRAAWVNIMAQIQPEELQQKILSLIPEISATPKGKNELRRIISFCKDLHSNGLSINTTSISKFQQFSFPGDLDKILMQISYRVLKNSYSEIAADPRNLDKKAIAIANADKVSSTLKNKIAPRQDFMQRLIRKFGQSALIIGLTESQTDTATLSFLAGESNPHNLSEGLSKSKIRQLLQQQPAIIRTLTENVSEDGKKIAAFAYIPPNPDLQTNIIEPAEANAAQPLLPYPVHTNQSNPSQKITYIPAPPALINGTRLSEIHTVNQFIETDPELNAHFKLCRLSGSKNQTGLNAAWLSLICLAKDTLHSRVHYILEGNPDLQLQDTLKLLQHISSDLQSYGISALLNKNGSIKYENELKTITLALLKSEVNRNLHGDYTDYFASQINAIETGQALDQHLPFTLHTILQLPCITYENANSAYEAYPPALKLMKPELDPEYVINAFYKEVDVQQLIKNALHNHPVIVHENGHSQILLPSVVFDQSMALTTNNQNMALSENNAESLGLSKAQVYVRPFDMPEDDKFAYFNSNATSFTRNQLAERWPLDIDLAQTHLTLNSAKLNSLSQPRLFVSVSKGFYIAQTKKYTRPQSFLCIAYDSKPQHTIAFRPNDAGNSLEAMMQSAKVNAGRLVHMGKAVKDARVVDSGVKNADKATDTQKKRAEYSAEDQYFEAAYRPYIDYHKEPSRDPNTAVANNHLISFELPVTQLQLNKLLTTLNKVVPVIFNEEHAPFHAFGQVGNDHLTGTYETGIARSTIEYSKEFTDVDFIKLVCKLSGIKSVDAWLPNVQKILEETVDKRITQFLPDMLKPIEAGIRSDIKNQSMVLHMTLDLFQQSDAVLNRPFHKLTETEALKLISGIDSWRSIVTSLERKDLSWNYIKNSFMQFTTMYNALPADQRQAARQDYLFTNLIDQLKSISKFYNDNTSGLLNYNEFTSALEENNQSPVASLISGTSLGHILSADAKGQTLAANLEQSISDTLTFVARDLRDSLFEARGEVFHDLNSLTKDIFKRKEARQAFKDASTYGGLSASAALNKMTQDTALDEQQEQELLDLESEIQSKIISFSQTTRNLLENNDGNSKFLEPVAQNKMLNMHNQIRDLVTESIAHSLIQSIAPEKFDLRDTHAVSAFKDLTHRIKLDSYHESSLIPSLNMTSQEISNKSALLSNLIGRYCGVVIRSLENQYKAGQLSRQDLLIQIEKLRDSFSRPVAVENREILNNAHKSLFWASFAKHARLGTLENANRLQKMAFAVMNPSQINKTNALQVMHLQENTGKKLISMFARGVGAVDPFDKADAKAAQQLSDGTSKAPETRTHIIMQDGVADKNNAKPVRRLTLEDIIDIVLSPIKPDSLKSRTGIESRLDTAIVKTQQPKVF